jgi:hypothetical protein
MIIKTNYSNKSILMDDKQLTNQQSLDLISSMIVNTRKNFNRKGGMMFVIWGYATAVVAMAVYLCVRLTGNPDFFWLWYSLPVAGSIFTLLHFRKNQKGVATYLDRVVNSVWITFCVACACSVITYSTGVAVYGIFYMNLLLLISIMASVATAVTGMIIRFRPVTISGFAGIPLSLLLPLLDGLDQTLGIAAIFLLVMAVPGSILNCRERKGTA